MSAEKKPVPKNKVTVASNKAEPVGGNGDPRRKSSWGTFTRIVALAIDPSANARFAFESGIGVPAEEWTKLLNNMNAKTRKLEEDYESECMKRKLKYKIVGESFKNVGEGIIRLAEDENADLIVLGTRGLNTSGKASMGSVSEFVTRNASVPVLVMRAKKIIKA